MVRVRVVFDHGCSHLCPASLLLLAVHSCLSRSSKCNSPAQARTKWWSGTVAFLHCALVVVLCASSDLVQATIRGMTFRDRRSTLDLVVVFGAC